MKMLYTPLIVLAVIGIIFFLMNSTVESKEERSERLETEAKLGTALFQHWSSYEVISELFMIYILLSKPKDSKKAKYRFFLVSVPNEKTSTIL